MPLPATNDGEGSFVEVRMGGKSGLREVLETVGLTFIVFLLARTLVQNYIVEGHSMDPSLSDAQYLLVDRASYARWDHNLLPRLLGADLPAAPGYVLGTGPQRGDIVVFHAWDEDKDYIKRVIALPGETVAVHDNQVFINGVVLKEPYIKDAPYYSWPPPGTSGTVPADNIFVLGDNRNNSQDSHIKGFLPTSHLVGRAWISYWPGSTIGPLPHATYDLPATP